MTVVLSFQPSAYRVTIHYGDCYRYLGGQFRRLPFPRSVRFVACRFCHPSEEDIRAAVPGWAETVEWYAYSSTRGAVTVVPWFARAEEVAARRSLGWGKTAPRSTRWAS